MTYECVAQSQGIFRCFGNPHADMWARYKSGIPHQGYSSKSQLRTVGVKNGLQKRLRGLFQDLSELGCEEFTRRLANCRHLSPRNFIRR